jgi:hypothetical protein
MSFMQRFFTLVLPRRLTADMEAESRLWHVQCPCGFEESVWDMGGIRWRATGSPRWQRVCPQCGEKRLHTVYKKDASAKE